MYVRHLGLRDFRSWAQVDLELAPGVTVLVGPNGYGKTNLIEALWYSATLGSHRVATDRPLIRSDTARAVISTIVVNDGRELAVDLEINVGRPNKARLNRAPVRNPREVVGVLRAVLFAPEDLALVRGEPADRRRYLDELASIRRPRIYGVCIDYARVLRQRTALLKSAPAALRRGDPAVADTLEAWDAQLAAHGAELMAARIELVDRLAPHVAEAYRLLAPGSPATAIGYRPRLEGYSTGSGVVELRAGLLEALARRRPAELERGMCLVGPHRDDLELQLNNRVVKGFASHGESWSMALALRLASYRLLQEEGAEPVLLLDDVFAELDSARREALAGVAAQAGQVLVTAAVPEDVPDSFPAKTVQITVVGDAAERVSELVGAAG